MVGNKTVSVRSANALRDEVTERIIAVGPPLGEVTVDERRETFDRDAATLAEALADSLPGGTYDRLLGLMLTTRFSELIVSHGRAERARREADAALESMRRPEPPSGTVVAALVFLLTRIGSWTNARFDQHLRHEMGDDAADETMAWLEENVSPLLAKVDGMPAYLTPPQPPEPPEPPRTIVSYVCVTCMKALDLDGKCGCRKEVVP